MRQDDGTLWRLRGASDFAPLLKDCPLRYVLSDELVRTCIALTYAGGDGLGGCLDLLHLPAERLWIEWNEAARCEELARCWPGCARAAGWDAERAGLLIAAHPGGRSARLRTFWLPREEPREPALAAVETLLDLDGGVSASPSGALLEGVPVALADSGDECTDALLHCARFRLDALWQEYYGRVTHGAALRAQLTEQALASVAFDVPLLLALLLLLCVRDDLVRAPVNPLRLNAKRARLGRPPLLEHLEISCPVLTPPCAPRDAAPEHARRAPRLHHVRGHLVRRHDSIYWRSPHWRGHVRLGCVRSRTVELRLPD